MPQGRYTVMDGDGAPVGSEDFRCAPGPAGWRYVGEISTRVPSSHDERVDLVADGAWRAVRAAISTGEHDLVLEAAGERLRGTLDGREIETRWDSQWHLDYLSPAFNVLTAARLDATTEIDVISLEPVTCMPIEERQRYERLGEEEIATPVGRFLARRWRFTALRTGWSRDLWVTGDVVVRYDGLYELEAYEPGASGPRPQA